MWTSECVSGHTSVGGVLCWWVRDYLGLIGDNISAAGKNMEQGTPGKHKMRYSARNTEIQCKEYRNTVHNAEIQEHSGVRTKEVGDIV